MRLAVWPSSDWEAPGVAWGAPTRRNCGPWDGAGQGSQGRGWRVSCVVTSGEWAGGEARFLH